MHGDGISPSVSQMSTDPGAEPFICLTDIDGFAIVIVKSVDTKLKVANLPLTLRICRTPQSDSVTIVDQPLMPVGFCVTLNAYGVQQL